LSQKYKWHGLYVPPCIVAVVYDDNDDDDDDDPTLGTTSTRATGLIATSQVYVAVHVVPTIRLQGNL